jgi:chemotaxis signal transduction protein
MTDNSAGYSLTAQQLRNQFDASFALPLRSAPEAAERFLLVRLGVEASTYALHLAQIRAVLPIGKLVSVPTKLPALLGLVAVRGEVIPVYGTAALLGVAQEAPRWFATATASPTPSSGSVESVGFAFGQLDAYVEVPSDMGAANPGALGSGGTGSLARRVIQTASGTHGVLDLSALLNGIQQRIGAARANKEI